MKSYELLDLIGEVNEDYVLAAGENVARPRFRWSTWAVCAACAALIVAAYPAYRAFRPQAPASAFASKMGDTEAAQDSDDALIQNPSLHEYTLVEGGPSVMTTQGDAKAPAGSGSAPIPEPAQPPRGDGPSDTFGAANADSGAGDHGVDGTGYSAPAQDAPVQAAAEWYDALLRTYRLEENPEWYGGAWLAGDELLAVAIVDGFHTSELENELTQAAGAGAELRFSTVKYSMEFLYGLMEPTARALDGTGLVCGIGVDVEANCLGVDLYSDVAAIPDSVLAALAHLDPEGDAIRVRVFTQSMNTLTDEAKKGPAPDHPAASPVYDGARVEPSVEAEPTPAPVADGEQPMPAADPDAIEELPQAKYDIIEGE